MNRKVVIITGGARGIGFGIARCFAARKTWVVIADLDKNAAVEAAGKLRREGAPAACGLECDIADRKSVEKMVKQTVTRYGQIDVLVNNAGICPFVDVMDMEPDVWQKTIDVDLTGAFHCTQLAAREMIRQGQGGSIICITSLAETYGGPSQVDYAAAKSGLRMMAVAFCTALGPHGINVNSVAPGHVCTEMTRHHWEIPKNAAYARERIPMGRLADPSDIGHACVFLASEEGRYVSGTTLRVDGGFMAINK
jgi:L-rhamnose 1-dehydrogenase